MRRVKPALTNRLLRPARGADGVNGPAQTTAFLTTCLTTVLIAAAVRRALIPLWVGPYLPYYLWLLVPIVLSWFAVQWQMLNVILDTVPLTGGQWLIAAGLALVPVVVIEVDKAVGRARPSGRGQPVGA